MKRFLFLEFFIQCMFSLFLEKSHFYRLNILNKLTIRKHFNHLFLHAPGMHAMAWSQRKKSIYEKWFIPLAQRLWEQSEIRQRSISALFSPRGNFSMTVLFTGRLLYSSAVLCKVLARLSIRSVFLYVYKVQWPKTPLPYRETGL